MRKSLTVINLKMATNKKRKVDTESRIFQEKWTIDYFFTQINENPVCLLCSESVSVMKEYNVRRHYVTKHSAKYLTVYLKLTVFKVNAGKKRFKI